MKYTANKVYQEDNVANEYDKKRFYGIKGRFVDWREKKLMVNAIKDCGIVPPAQIIDVPTGTARLAIDLANIGYDVTGLDISNKMIEQGRKKLQNTPIENKVKFEVGNGESLPFQDATFDCSVSLRLFGHVPPDTRCNILKELSRVSKSHVVIAYYGKHTLQTLLRKKSRAKRQVPWYPVNNKEIQDELKEANLKIIKTKWLIPLLSETIIVIAKKI